MVDSTHLNTELLGVIPAAGFIQQADAQGVLDANLIITRREGVGPLVLNFNVYPIEDNGSSNILSNFASSYIMCQGSKKK